MNNHVKQAYHSWTSIMQLADPQLGLVNRSLMHQ